MRKRLLALVVVLVMLTAITLPASAGGWASVTLNGDPESPLQEVPWTIEFLVKQHDVSPVNVSRAYLSATHRPTGETITADAVQVGDVGNYSVTAVFPLAGDWKWSITPEPFSASSFATLTVLASAKAALNGEPLAPHPAHVHSGTCATLGDVVFPLGNVQAGDSTSGTPSADTATAPATSIVASSVTTIESALSDLLASEHAINIHKSEADIGTYIACGDIAGIPAGGQLVIALTPLNDSGTTGVAVLQEEGTSTTVTVYLVEPAPAAATPVAATGPSVEVLAIGDSEASWQFTPVHLEITAGTTVVWLNASSVHHTVSAPNLDFEDSGYLDPGESFQQTFTSEGTYSFHCDPHPWMTGFIEVR
jgi:plastocyanin